MNMFEHDHSAARGHMATRKLIVFKHDSPMGNNPAHKLFDMVKVASKNSPPREFTDYTINVPSQTEMPPGVTVTDML